MRLGIDLREEPGHVTLMAEPAIATSTLGDQESWPAQGKWTCQSAVAPPLTKVHGGRTFAV